ncbi:phosphoribosylglycinamide formyltransferase [Allosphingosinicella vermicomposti]|uniref:phosphoribosylglycinamide formyltransferase n=1 Tax=Allosphingosinicella vermicomposti TaxID=614671 RepID=UPI000D112098|nr:phosphoribosylglycinamide formyltransferase [Allosphingosinicella vermicomposti]
MADKVRVGVLISGRGSNLEALADYKRKADPAYEIVVVASNVPEARGLVLAKRFDIPTWAQSHKGVKRAEFDALVDAELRRSGVEVIALAGYMRLLSPEFIHGWNHRILNIHPSLLPDYKGLDTHQRALMGGEEYAGCSVHVVTEELDDGPVIAQARVRVQARDTAETLAQRVLVEEHKLYPAALDAFCRKLLADRAAS